MTDHGARPDEQVAGRRFRPTLRAVVIAYGLVGVASIAGMTWQVSVPHGQLPLAGGLAALVMMCAASLVFLARGREDFSESVDELFDEVETVVKEMKAEFRADLIEMRSMGRTTLVRSLTRLAGLLAGRRHSHLRDAWAADLYGNPESGQLPSFSRRRQMAAGDVKAALRCRFDDAADLAWRPVDALLASWRGSRLAVFTPVTVIMTLVLSHEGFYGLITNADNLGVIAAAAYAAIKVLRKYRQIATPKRPERKTSSADSSER